MGKKEELLRKIIREEVQRALTRELKIEDGHSEPGVTKVTTRMVNVIDHLSFYLPHIEAAIRGMQTDVNRNNTQLRAIGEILLGLEKCVMTITNVAGNLKRLDSSNDGVVSSKKVSLPFKTSRLSKDE